MTDRLFLAKGAHTALTNGACAMEWVAWAAGEAHSDRPACVSPLIGAFVRDVNDVMDDDLRQTLVPVLLDCIGTNTGPADDLVRSYLALDWIVRVYTPTWLRLAHLDVEADALVALPPLVDRRTVECSIGAWYAAGDAARAAAWAASWYAAGDAARDAAWAAAWYAARDTAWDAAGYAAWDASWYAARDTAWDAAGYAARAAARYAARYAARAAARYAAPTVIALQRSAVDLLRAMCAVGQRQSVECVPERVAALTVTATHEAAEGTT